MSGIQTFLTPYSHLIFANRNIVIVVLAVVLGWTVIQLLVARWRTERLERELTTARSNQSTSPARPRHLPAQLAEEAPAESGSLPPIKGGRSYARNLGSALQKAGIPAGPQLYSPPVPQGWNPNTGNGQPNPAQAPMQPPTYAPAPAPWGAPPAQPAPWAYPAGANRPPFPAQPGGPMPAPYAPQTQGPPPANPSQMFPPAYPAVAPGPEQPRLAMDATTAAAPWAAPAALAPVQPPVAPNVPLPADTPADDAGGKETGRRGKPKRRRFSLSVLDNLEKMVQPKSAEPAGQTTVAAAPVAVPQAAVPSPALVETPNLFEPAAPAQAEPETEAVEAVEADLQPETQTDLMPEPEPEPEPVVAPVSRSSRPDMRSMLFGEEPEPVAPAIPVAEAAVVDEVSEPAEETSSSYTPDTTDRWSQPESEPELEPVAVAEEAQVESEAEPQPEPVIEAVDEAPVAEPEVEPATAASEDAPTAETADSSESAEPAPAEPGSEATAASGGAGVVVIIEDDKVAADYYATLFRGNGYTVDVANDGVSGVDLCVRVQPQVILLDVMMPRQNGILVLQTLRASDETRNTPVVVMSNFSEPTLIKRALQLGALEYVIKTQVEGAALLTAIPHWINREKAFAA